MKHAAYGSGLRITPTPCPFARHYPRCCLAQLRGCAVNREPGGILALGFDLGNEGLGYYFPFRKTKVRVYCGMVTRRNSG